MTDVEIEDMLTTLAGDIRAMRERADRSPIPTAEETLESFFSMIGVFSQAQAESVGPAETVRVLIEVAAFVAADSGHITPYGFMEIVGATLGVPVRMAGDMVTEGTA